MVKPIPISDRRRRTLLVFALGLSILLAAIVAWRATSLRGLPDIGDPFDVAAFSAVKVRDEDNAAILYRQSIAILREFPGNNPQVHWSQAGDAERAWLEANRESLAIWRKATERPDALFIRPSDLAFNVDTDFLQKIRAFVRLVGLESSRLELEGDFASAWEWHRASLRSSRHCGSHGIMIERLVGIALYQVSAFRVTSWASDPKVDAAALRRALAEVQEIYSKTASTSISVKCEYLGYQQTSPEAMREALETTLEPDRSTSGRIPRTIFRDAEMILRREPERSRRLFRLFVANWLVGCDLPPGRRPPHDRLGHPFFQVDDSAPPSARVFTAAELVAWNESTVLLRRLTPAFNAFLAAVDRERGIHANLIVHLASELYRREHGNLPESNDLLIGPYLEALPEGLSAIAP